MREPSVPEIRVRSENQQPVRPDGEYVLYWMTAYRRPYDNFSLDRAVWWSRRLQKPLVVFDPLRVGYRWASDRIHRFVVDAMAANARAFAGKNVLHYPYLEPEPNAGHGLMEAWGKRAAVVITDDFPCFFLPQLVRLVGRRLDVLLEVVDSNGLLPMRSASKVYDRAYTFRIFLHRELPKHLANTPLRDALSLPLPMPCKAPEEISARWPPVSPEILADPDAFLSQLPIDHEVHSVQNFLGGWTAAEKQLGRFLARLDSYEEDRNDPDADAGSRLSPFLHFGCISPHHVLKEIADIHQWTPEKVDIKFVGKNRGWWKLPGGVESFLDELVTWREIGYNMCWQDKKYDQFESLPAWAQKTLEDHADDQRATLYTLQEFAESRTHDPLWNAAQRQLVREGRIHNYLRMLWGKKILEWTKHPREALEVMLELNNRYALDGRNPNSYTGIFWILGRYDRPWGPNRPIYGSIRYMSSDNTYRKLEVKKYLERFRGPASDELF